MSSSSADYVYLNINITNDTDAPINATYQKFWSEAIIDNPSDYYLSIIRTTIPTSLIPIFLFPVAPTYSVTLRMFQNQNHQLITLQNM